MSINMMAPRVTLNPSPYIMRFFLGLPLSKKRKTRLEKRLIITRTTSMIITVLSTLPF